MSEPQVLVSGPAHKAPTAVDPAAAEPVAISAQEANVDPVRPMATDSLTAASRSEVAPAGATAADVPVTDVKEDNLAKNEEVVEAQPINEGILGYKAPGLVKSLIFSKKFFWFNDEPLESEHLSGYLRAEKAEVTHHNVAHAGQTGKGLLFFAKRVEDKDHPTGILNLSDVSDVTKGDLNEFTFKLHGHKHGFQAPTKAERDGWLVAIETRLADAKASRDTITGSEGFKSRLEQLGIPKPAAVAGAATTAGKSRSTSRPLKATDSKVHDGSLTTDAVASAGSSSDEGKTKHKKDRSQSRKRGSLFGALLGKKEEYEEKKEIKKEEKAEEKAVKQDIKKEEKIEKEEAKAEKKLEKEEAKDGIAGGSAPLDAVAVASRVLAQPVVPEDGTKVAPAEETSGPLASEPAVITSTAEAVPKPVKRNSLFGNLWGKKDSGALGAKDGVPAGTTKEPETTPVSATAPRIEAPINSTSTEPPAATPAPTPVVDATDSAPVGTASPLASPTTPSTDKRKSSFFNALGGKKEKRVEGVSEAEGIEGEGRKSNAGKFTGLFRKPSRATPPAHRETSAGVGAPPTVPEDGVSEAVPEAGAVNPKSPSTVTA